ncbi:hypothetical protein CAPTEDRAFT_202830 [Capitella teleta]|uniref:G-protein coupled receptors family 1 profile domain-containing protein n=1 Tax=Capitella teleta TaxID=283909 RepID=R7TAD6_CAPTE|nr:hypothetical protein CAPTEDRAFT_202830 [Capitella teleta]|eukprot:ELT87979.1 hypothetical protein CAPTEDRAFT_202830 [Capitella teleta]
MQDSTAMQLSTASAQTSDMENSLSGHDPWTGSPLSQHDYTCHWYYIIINSITVALVCCIGIPANVLTGLVLSKRKKKSPTMVLICTLAALDILSLIGQGVASILKIVATTTDDVILKANVRIFYHYLGAYGATLMTATINLTALIMWCRYKAITSKHVIREQRKTWKLMSPLAIGIAVIYQLPRFFELKYIATTSQGIFIFQRNSFSVSPLYENVYKSFLNFTLFLYVPITLMTVMAFKATRALRSKCQKGPMTLAEINQRQITVSLIGVVGLSVVCYCLAPVRNILLYFYRDPSDVVCGGVVFYVTPVLVLLIVVNCSLNFFIYTWCTERFRRQVARLLCQSKRAAVSPHATDIFSTNSTAHVGPVLPSVA